jgi:hypothetical protein
MAKRTFMLPQAMPASNDCLPHAAMNLGKGQGMGVRPAALVARLVLDEQYGNFVLYRLDADGGFVGDSWHGSLNDALWQAKKEFGVEWPPENSDGR